MGSRLLCWLPFFNFPGGSVTSEFRTGAASPKTAYRLQPAGFKRKGIRIMDDMQMIDQAAAAPADNAAEVQGVQIEAQQEPERKYTDDDVNKIIARKIAAERKRMERLFQEDQQVSELEIRERNVLKRELKADARDILAEQGHPQALAEMLNYGSREEMLESIKVIGSAFKAAVQEEVAKRVRGVTPKASYGHPIGGGDALHDAFRSGGTR